MTTEPKLSMTVALVFIAGEPALAAPKLPSVASVATRHIAALGGRDRIDSIQTISFRGAWIEGGESLPMTSFRMRPYYFLDAPKVDPAYYEGYDGRSWEYYGKYGVVLRTAGSPGAATSRASEFGDPLVDFATAGKPAYDILVTSADGFQKHLFVDETTFLIVGNRQVANVYAFGAQITTTSKDFDLRTGREIDRLTWSNMSALERLYENRGNPSVCESA